MKAVCITPFGKQDYLTECIIEGLKQLNVDIVHTDHGNGLQGTFIDDYVVGQGKDADVVLAFWSKNRTPAPRYHLLERLSHIPSAYIDGSEYNCTGYHKENAPWLQPDFLAGRTDYYFKRECMPEDLQKGIIPLPFAARQRDFWSQGYPAKEHDIFCAFGQVKMDPLRSHLQIMCNTMASKGENVIVGPLANVDYRIKTALSRISVNAHGGGEDCMRFWEILAARSACFTQRFNIVMPDPFVDGKTMVEFDNCTEFLEKKDYYLSHPELLEEITENGYQHLRRYHTTQARAKYMLEAMGWDFPE